MWTSIILLGSLLLGSQDLMTPHLTPSAHTPNPTIEQNLQNGSQLALSDGSVYEIDPKDRPKTSFWLSPVSLTIGSSGNTEYPVLLTNNVTGISVKAKQLQAP